MPDTFERQNTRDMARKVKIVPICLATATIAVVAGGWFYINNLAYETCRVEAGIEVVASDFLKTPNGEAYFTEDSESFSIVEPGEYHIKVKNGLFTHSSVLVIQDTEQPKGQVGSKRLLLGETCKAEDFVVEAEDNTRLDIMFVEEPDFTKAGIQTVQIGMIDQGRNILILPTELLISPIVREFTVEAGESAPQLKDFMVKSAEVEASLITDLSAINMKEIGMHTIAVESGGYTYETALNIVDTVPPQVQMQSLSGYTLLPREIEEFIVSITDVTAVTTAFVKEPDFSVEGTQVVEIAFTDAGGNTVTEQAELILEADVETPMITGVADIEIFMGDAISYRKNVTVTDNCEEGLHFEIDNSQVNPNEPGSYPVIYRATDLAGNVTEQTITVTIKKRAHTIEEVNALADEVLAKILEPEMTPMEKVQAIYNYNMRHIGYVNHSEKEDWVQAAYEGIVERKGDCYVYASTAKLLLTRAGITNMDIAKIPARTSHYWNLVDVGDGWYHFDTTPRRDHPTIFMWTDEQMMEYSNKHGKSHNYDPACYPEIN